MIKMVDNYKLNRVLKQAGIKLISKEILNIRQSDRLYKVIKDYTPSCIRDNLEFEYLLKVNELQWVPCVRFSIIDGVQQAVDFEYVKYTYVFTGKWRFAYISKNGKVRYYRGK